MLTSRYLASCSDDIVRLYSQLEEDIVITMAQRLQKLGVTPSSEWMARIYKETGGLQSDINAILKKYDVKGQKMLSNLFDVALKKADAKDTSMMTAAKRELSDSQRQRLEMTLKFNQNAGIIHGNKKTDDEALNGGAIKVFSGIQRLTQTIASTAQSDFVNAANRAYMQVMTGAFDYKTAIREGVLSLANKGIDTVEYTDSGKAIHKTIESAVRSNVMTGINKLAAAQTLDNADNADTDLVEVSAHMGARNRDIPDRAWANHEDWQGKVYCLSGERDYVDADGKTHHAFNFYEVCHPDEPDGICGINCRHSFYPYFEGTSQQYSKTELDEYKDKRVTINGIEMTQYEAEQKQRQCERQVRKYKRIANALDAVGEDSTGAKIKVKQWQSKIDSICDQANLRRDYSREFVGAKGIKGTLKEPIITKTITPIDTSREEVVKGVYFNKITNQHSWQDDLKATNPKCNAKSKDDTYTSNCQRCVSAYILRRRGLDVEALGYYGDDTIGEGQWYDVYKGGAQHLKQMSDKTMSGSREKVEAEMLSYGDGAQAIIKVNWARKRFNHVFIVENHGGQIVFIDPQSNIQDCAYYFDFIAPKETQLLRVDNLEFNDNIKYVAKDRGKK